MAAVPLSNQYSIFTSPRLFALYISKSPQFGTKSLPVQSHRHPHISHSYKPILGLSPSLPNSSLGKSWRSCKSLCSIKDTTFETSDEDKAHSDDLEESESDADQESSLSTKSLLQLYKEAILDKDGTTVSDIEATLCHVENEKNKLLEQITALSAETSAGKEKYIRLQADFDNFRKRSEKERLTVRTDAQGEVIESLLPMVDNFERAKQQLKLETEQEKKIDASYQGIYRQFVEIMRSLSVAVVPTVGKPFDPSVHEAISREESREFNEGIVIEEFRRGFLLGGRLLRPAMVKVSAGPGRAKSDEAHPNELIDNATETSPQESTDSNGQPQTANLANES